MRSENPTGADNQQETARSTLELDPNWVVGFVDGEGCFSVSVHRNLNVRRTGGWQLHPVFHVYQHQDHRGVLEALVTFFGTGRLRPKGPQSSVLTYAVDSLAEIAAAVLPFFDRHPLRVKEADFRRFAAIVRGMRPEGASGTLRIRASRADRLFDEREWEATISHDRRSTCRILRDCTPGTTEPTPVPNGEDTVRPSWRHEESGRNDLTTSSAFEREWVE